MFFKNGIAQQIFENVNNDILSLIVIPYDRQATLYEYLFMQMFQFKAAVLNDRYYELFSLSMSEEATSKSVKELYYDCNIRFSSHSSTDSAYFIMTSALLIGMKSELIRLSRKSDMDEITLDKTLDFFVKELLEFIHPAKVEDLDEYKHKLLSDFDTYYVDIVKGFTPVLVKIP